MDIFNILFLILSSLIYIKNALNANMKKIDKIIVYNVFILQILGILNLILNLPIIDYTWKTFRIFY